MRKNLRYVLQQQPIFKQVVNSLHSNLQSIIAIVRVFHKCGFLLYVSANFCCTFNRTKRELSGHKCTYDDS